MHWPLQASVSGWKQRERWRNWSKQIRLNAYIPNWLWTARNAGLLLLPVCSSHRLRNRVLSTLFRYKEDSPKNIGGKWKRLTKTLESKCMQQQIVKRASYSQIRNTLFGHCSIIVFKIHVGLLLRWLQGCVRMLHCQFSPLEAFKDVLGIYVEHNNLEKKNIVGRIIPTTGNLTPVFFTVTLISVLAHPKKVMLQGLSWRVLWKTQMHHQSLCLPCQSDEHNCTINNFRQLRKITLRPSWPIAYM